MNHFTPKYTDASSWDLIRYTATGGSRSKVIIKNEVGESYFFKGSKTLEDGTVRYRHEFWSEIVSSKIGNWLGFDILDYEVGYHKDFTQGIGCLSRSMVDHSKNALSEGKDYLSGFDSTYNPVKDENRYTFGFIKASIQHFDLQSEIPKLVETMVFDALVGNSDRHQENWGFILKYEEVLGDIDKAMAESGWLPRAVLRLFRWGISQSPKYYESSNSIRLRVLKNIFLKQSQFTPTLFSPIYDSGCCLGRELVDEKVDEMLANSDVANRYVNRSKSEIRLKEGKKKPRHWEVVGYLLKEHESETKTVLERVKKIYNKEIVSVLIEDIDKNLPEEMSKHKLPKNRKALMVCLIDLRVQKLLSLI